MTAVDMFLHVDRHLIEFAATYGVWIYVLLFLLVFLETGVVVTPFLPGDSLLFATGALAAAGVIDIVGVLSLRWLFIRVSSTSFCARSPAGIPAHKGVRVLWS